MEEKSLDIAGTLVVWSMKPGTRLDLLNIALAKHGFTGFQHERMTDAAALKAALAEEFPRKHKIVTVVGNDDKDSDSYEVIRIERKTAEENTYTHVLTAAIAAGVVSTDSWSDYDLQIRIAGRVGELTTLVPGSQVTKTLVQIIHSLNGLTMKEEGHIYWLPESQLKRWQALICDIETTGSQSSFDAYVIKLTPEAIKGISSNLAREIDKEAFEISSTLASDDTGVRAANNAKKRAQELRDKVATFEGSFGLALDDLKQKLDDATNMEAKATLLETAAQLSFCTLFN